MSKTPFLDFYKDCMVAGLMPAPGLCNSVSGRRMMRLITKFSPIERSEFWDPYYWGYDGTCKLPHELTADQKHEFTPLRQTIVLFCAAMNGELDNLK